MLVVFQHLDGVEHHQTADLLAQIAPTGADQLGNTTAKLVNTYTKLLATGTGRADDADVAAAHRVAKTECRAVDDGGATVRTHHQQAFLMG
ncbi:hypothetical protein D3C73_1130640 [compost metagenome]